MHFRRVHPSHVSKSINSPTQGTALDLSILVSEHIVLTINSDDPMVADIVFVPNEVDRIR